MRFPSIAWIAALSLAAAGAGAQAQAEAASVLGEYREGAKNPFIEHAPLALFSVGSLAMGAFLYAMQPSWGADHPGTAADRSNMSLAVATAGVGSLAAAITYFYYAHRDTRRAREWQASLSGGLGADGSLRAAVTVPLRAPVLR